MKPDIHSYIRPGAHAHLVGIGGVSMSPLAEVLHNAGVVISGSDLHESAAVSHLRSLGIPVVIGHRGESVQGAGCVIRTAAVHDDNPEIAAARAAAVGDADRIRRNRGPGDLRHLERKVAGRGVCAASCGGCQERRGCANRHLSEVHKRGGFIRIRKIFAISGIQKYTAPAYRTGIF
mgnify:CR=1 FL=1